MTPLEGPDVPLVNMVQTLSLNFPNVTSLSFTSSLFFNSPQFNISTSNL